MFNTAFQSLKAKNGLFLISSAVQIRLFTSFSSNPVTKPSSKVVKLLNSLRRPQEQIALIAAELSGKHLRGGVWSSDGDILLVVDCFLVAADGLRAGTKYDVGNKAEIFVEKLSVEGNVFSIIDSSSTSS